MCKKDLLDGGARTPHTKHRMQVYESSRMIGFARCACAAVLGLSAASCIGPGLEPPGGGDRQTASASAGTGATGVTGPTATARPGDNPNATGTQPPTMQPAATAGSSAPTTAPVMPAQDAGAQQPGQPGAAGKAAETPPGKDDDAGVP